MSGDATTVVVRCSGHATPAGPRQPEVARARKSEGAWSISYPYGDETQALDAADSAVGTFSAIVGRDPAVDRYRVVLSCPGCRQRVVIRSREALHAALDVLVAAQLESVDFTILQRAVASLARTSS